MEIQKTISKDDNLLIAGLWKRLLAVIVDCSILLILLIPLLIYFNLICNCFFTLLILFLCYEPIFNMTPLKTTPGKKLLGLEILQLNNEKPELSQLLRRAFFKYLFIIGASIIFYTAFLYFLGGNFCNLVSYQFYIIFIVIFIIYNVMGIYGKLPFKTKGQFLHDHLTGTIVLAKPVNKIFLAITWILTIVFIPIIVFILSHCIGTNIKKSIHTLTVIVQEYGLRWDKICPSNLCNKDFNNYTDNPLDSAFFIAKIKGGSIEVAEKYIEVNQPDKALELLFQALFLPVSREYKRDNVWIVIARAYAKAGKYDKALKIAEDKSDKIDDNCYDCMRFINSVLTEIIKEYGQNNFTPKNVDLSSTIIKILKNIKEYRKHSNSGVVGSGGIGYAENIVIEYAKIGQYDEGMRIVNDIGGDENNIIELQRKIIKEYIKAGKFDKAVYVANTMKNNPGKISLLRDISDEYVYIKDYNKALKILSQALKETSMIPWFDIEISCLTNIAENYIKLGKRNKALEILTQALDKAKQHHAWELFANIADKYIKLKQYNEALKILELLLQKIHVMDTRDLIDIAEKLIDAGQKSKGSEILEQALRIAKAEKDDKTDSLIDIAEQLIAAGQNFKLYKKL